MSGIGASPLMLEKTRRNSNNVKFRVLSSRAGLVDMAEAVQTEGREFEAGCRFMCKVIFCFFSKNF